MILRCKGTTKIWTHQIPIVTTCCHTRKDLTLFLRLFSIPYPETDVWTYNLITFQPHNLTSNCFLVQRSETGFFRWWCLELHSNGCWCHGLCKSLLLSTKAWQQHIVFRKSSSAAVANFSLHSRTWFAYP